MKIARTQVGSFFRVSAAILAAVFFGGAAQAQLTNNPFVNNTTNTTALSPIGTSGFGIALLGYPMKNVFGGNFFANQLDGVVLSDASTAPESGNLQFYAASHEQVKATGTNLDDIVGFRILQPTATPNSLTVYKSFVSTIQTNTTYAGALQNGGQTAGSTGLGGVSKNGTIVLRMDGSSAPGGALMPGECVVVLPAQVNSAVILSNGIEGIGLNGATVTDAVLAVDAASGNIPQIGQNQNLAIKNSFNAFTFAARTNINAANAGTLSVSSNGQGIVTSGAAVAPGTVGFYNVGGTFATRGAMGMNDTAKKLVTFVKTAADITTGGDSITGLLTIKYTDSGTGPISPTSLQTNYFGKTAAGNFITGGTSGINTNGQYFFSRSPFVGPGQHSINDSGAVAFAVSINCDANNGVTNGTRGAEVTGILYMPPGVAAETTNALKVCDNTDSTLFWQAPMTCSNKNYISTPALDNYGNVYFEAAYSNNTAFPCDLFPSNAVYQAVANNATNPTSWAVRILLRQGDLFTNTVSSDIFKITALPYAGSTAIKTIQSRSFGPNAINRSQLPGHTSANTVPSDPFAVGGILVQATVTNLTRGYSTDGLLYVAPYTQASGSNLAFVINSITKVGNDINLNWNGQIGSNIVQTSTGNAVGGYTNGPASFTDVTNLVLSTSVVTNYTQVGGATNVPSRYYRIKSVP